MTSLRSRVLSGVLRVGSRFGAPTGEALRDQLPKRPAEERLPRARQLRGITHSVEQHEGLDVHVLRPAGATPTRAVLYLHGGYYLFGINPLHWRFTARLAREASAVVYVPLYRTAPETTASSTVPCMARLLATLVARHGGDEVVLMGDSAGGGMALAVAQLSPPTRRVVLISPWLDVATDHPEQVLLERGDHMIKLAVAQEAGRLYAGELAVDDPLVSPVHGDLSGVGPVDVFVGSVEVVSVDAHRLAQTASQVTVHVAPRMQHVYPILPVPEGAAARRAIAALVRD